MFRVIYAKKSKSNLAFNYNFVYEVLTRSFDEISIEVII